MPRLKRKVENDLTVIHNEYLRDKAVGLTARGLLTTMLSKPDSWNFTIRGLASELRDGKHKIQTALNELEETGYLMRKTIIDEKGRFQDVLYIFSDEVMPEAIEAYKQKMEEHKKDKLINSGTEKPYPDFRDTDNRDTENPNPEKQDINKKIYKQINSEKIRSDKISINPSVPETVKPPVENSDGLTDGYLQYTKIVRQNIEYRDYADWIRLFVKDGSMSTEERDEIVGVIVRAICSTKKTEIICGQEYPREVIRSAMLKVDRTCIENALETMRQTDDIRNYEKYLISTLFNEANGRHFKENAAQRNADYAVKRDIYKTY